MSTHGRDSSDSPDVTARVMQRLGYENASSQRARELRRRAVVVRILQGLTVLSAIVLGAVWWFDGAIPAQRGPEVVDSLRGSFARGTNELSGFFAALPRLPNLQNQAMADASQYGPGVVPAVGTQVESPHGSLENAPQLRSY